MDNEQKQLLTIALGAIFLAIMILIGFQILENRKSENQNLAQEIANMVSQAEEKYLKQGIALEEIKNFTHLDYVYNWDAVNVSTTQGIYKSYYWTYVLAPGKTPGIEASLKRDPSVKKFFLLMADEETGKVKAVEVLDIN